MKTYKLDDLKAMAALDKSGCLLSLKYFSKQLKAAWGQANQLILPEMPLPSRVLFCAMGGSAYAGRIIKDLYSDEAEVSFEVIDDYDLPKYADDRTLIIAASYSGNTEETLSTFSQALARKIPLILVCGGGTLEKFGKQNNLPTYVFDGEFNPSKQPRLGQGYMIASQLAILAKMGLLKLSSGDFLKALDFLEEKNKLYPEHIPQAANPAKQIASQLENMIAVLVAGDFRPPIQNLHQFLGQIHLSDIGGSQYLRQFLQFLFNILVQLFQIDSAAGKDRTNQRLVVANQRGKQMQRFKFAVIFLAGQVLRVL